MIDIKLLRDEPERVRAAVSKKKFTCDIDAALRLDQRRREVVTAAEQARAAQKAANTEMAQLPKGSEQFQAKVAEMKELAAKVKELQAEQQQVDEQWQAALLAIPNLPDDSVPLGKDENANQSVYAWGEPSELVSADAKPHWEIPWFTDWVDLEAGVTITGAGFPVFKAGIARLVRGLVQYFLDENCAAGYVEIAPPYLVNAASATATGQLPDKEGQMYVVPEDGLYLIPTAEVPVTNLYRDHIFTQADLPVKHTAYSPCFRREAGSYGKDVRGLNRVHQFDKVELVAWVHPATSFEALEDLRNHAESLLQKLQLPYRRLLICAGDIGFPHAKQFDLDVWAGGQKRWLEVSSCSNFTDFQARRANIRFRGEDGKPQPVHTLNGSSLAIPRVLAAILENNLQADGKVRVPDVLRDRLGAETIGP